ncbi:MAG: BACON domain-containing protein [Methanobrevibacter sp.]|nr:BACON domain-containing protein [Methanobrevibacter sp.]
MPVMVPITITKLPSGNTLTLSPYNSTVDASSGTTTITVSSSLPVTMTYSGSMEVNSCTYSNGTITVNRKANTDEEYKRLYITCKAGDVSSSAIITQEGSGEFEFSIASPATVNVDAGYHKVYFDSPSFRGEIMEPYAETGILLVNGQ